MPEALRPFVGSQTALFEAAAEEFAERGFDAAGVDRIAARAGVNKAMIYYHYASKKGLYVAVLRDVFRAVGERARAVADGPGTARQKLDSWIATIVDAASTRPWFPPIMLRELASGAPRFDPETFALMNAIFVAVRDILAAGQRDDEFREVDPLLTHLTIMPPVLLFFARQRVLANVRPGGGLLEPRALDEFVRYMQDAMQRMLRKD
jgi:TetR/AcrR family transcriptional regulator